MIGDMSALFSRMIGTLAVILLVAAFIGGSDTVTKLINTEKTWKYTFFSGILGGVFGIYGNISGFDLNGAIISVRDIGPMLSGFIGGPVGGLIAGLIAGIHRLTMGGLTAQACVVATCSIGLMCGGISKKWHELFKKPPFALLISAAMEAFHLCVVLLMVRPFEAAMDIVSQIAIPFIAINAAGFFMMMIIITYTENQRILADEKSRMQSELEVANVIQHSLLPVLNEQYPGCRELDVSAYMEAAKEVGGDFYDVFYVDPLHLAFTVGDVSGKGVPAALFMASSKITLQNSVRDSSSLSKAIEVANNAICARNEAEMFVTLWVGVLDLTSGMLTFVSAGHNPAVLLRGNKAEFLKIKNGFVLGGMPNMKYKEYDTQLLPGDILCLYTDGVTEAEDRKHRLFGEERLLRCCENKNESAPAEIIEGVKKSIDDFIDGNSQFDDMTMLCVKWKGSADCTSGEQL